MDLCCAVLARSNNIAFTHRDAGLANIDLYTTTTIHPRHQNPQTAINMANIVRKMLGLLVHKASMNIAIATRCKR